MSQQDDASIEFLWNSHSYLNEYIRFADTKAEIVIGWTSAVIGALLASGFHKHFDVSIIGVLCFASLAVLVTAFVFGFMAVWPSA